MVSILIALKFNRKLTETISSGVYLFMLLAYILGITGHINHIILLMVMYEAAGFLALIYFCSVRRKDVRGPFADIGNIVFILLLIALWFLSLHMRVTNFDDFHSWAITPKDMFFVNGLPTGGMASSFYRDYFPTVYIVDFLMFKILGRFEESAMFFVLWGLMLVSLTEFLHYREEDGLIRYICRAAAGILLPFLISFQFLHCLGTDILATTIFGSALVYIMDKTGNDKEDIFQYIRIILTVTVLGMMKTTSLIFSMVCIGVYFVRCTDIRKLRSWLEFIGLSSVTGVFWLSWKIFCRLRGNTTYLSDNLEKNLSSGHSGLPGYAISTTKEFVLKLFTYGLNDGPAGLSAAVILLIFVVSFLIYLRRTGNTMKDRLALAVIIMGMIGYLMVMLYVYLFVFEEWEALSLSSYDRYISTYFGAMMYLALYLMFNSSLKPLWLGPALMLMLASTVNYGYVARTLVPSGYAKEYGGVIAEIDSIEKEFIDAAGEMPGYGENIVIVDYSDDQLRAKVLPYAAVPGVTRLVRPSEDGKMPDEREISEAADEYDARIVDLRR